MSKALFIVLCSPNVNNWISEKLLLICLVWHHPHPPQNYQLCILDIQAFTHFTLYYPCFSCIL